MRKYASIVDSPWTDQHLYAESIPHLLHWDLAYLWVLEKEPELRPTSWEARVSAWRYLTGMLLAGELIIVEEAIPRPLSDYTRQYGIMQIEWLVSPVDKRKIGVLSPTVLARPLPDFRSDDLDQWHDKRLVGRKTPAHERIARYFARKIVLSLNQAQSPGPFHRRLAALLTREFDAGENREAPNEAAPIHRTFRILGQDAWLHRFSGSQAVAEAEFQIQNGAGSPDYVPYCTCGKSLLRGIDAKPLVPSGGVLRIRCSCGEEAKIDLAELLIWDRDDRPQTIVWSQDHTLERPEKGYPPVPDVKGPDVTFEWEEQMVAGDKDLRFLRLRFPQRTVRTMHVDEIFYPKLLVPGRLDEDNVGYPIKWEWIDAVVSFDEVDIEVRPATNEVVYRNLRVYGWPARLRKVFANNLGLAIEPELSVGLFPDPGSVCGAWNWYRVFLEGHHGNAYQLNVADATALIPTLADTLEGCPQNIGVVKRSANEIGVLFHEEFGRRRKGEGEVYLGIDFGTTNTLAYFMSAEDIGREASPNRHALRPSQVADAVKWIAGERETVGGTVGSFLPPNSEPEGRTDPYLIPSALWELDGASLIRWSSDAPADYARPLTGFKWDKSQGGDRTLEREAFLSELMLVVAPWILRQLGLSSLERIEIKVGLAFPLAFGASGRMRMQRMLDRLKESLERRTGLIFDFFSVNEAIACVDAFGIANKGNTYLIADLGGRTLDVALYTARSPRDHPDVHQLGSVEFAGETFIEAFAAIKESDEERRDAVAWQIRDAIMSGQSSRLYGHEEAAARVLGRFRAAAFEYLRTMIAAFRERHDDQKIEIVLAGNGWHLSEAFNPDAEPMSWRSIYSETYRGMISRFGDPNLELFESPEMDALPSTKHFVVIGAMKNATGDARRRQLGPNQGNPKEAAETQVRLPAGRSVTFSNIGPKRTSKVIAWDVLIGEGAKFDDFSDQELKDASVDFDLNDMPQASDKWVSYLLSSFDLDAIMDLPYPTQRRLHSLLLSTLKGNPSGYFDKGPLQLILEETWAKYLRKV